MATYAMGDIQGCYKTFVALLDHMRFSPGRDHLFITGDLINRGPGSLDVLRYVHRERKNVSVVLGNHDLHVLGLWLGVAEDRRKDTVEELLEAPDGEVLMSWLRQQPLARREGKYLFVHAGVHPTWTVDATMEWAKLAQTALRGNKGASLLERWERRKTHCKWNPDSKRVAVKVLRVLTLMRTVDAEGALTLAYKGPPEQAPVSDIPWFDAPDRFSRDVTIVCGHWAAMGLRVRPDMIALDTGCVWGRTLTAMRLDDGVVFQQRLLDRVR